MLNKNMTVDLLKALSSGSEASLKKLQGKNGDAYVSSLYWLYERGIVSTPPGNFWFGGDDDEPIDMVDYVGICLTAKGRAFIASV